MRRLRRAALSGATAGALFALLVSHIDAPSAAAPMATAVSTQAPVPPPAPAPVATATPSPAAAPTPDATPGPSAPPTAAPAPQTASLNVQRSTPRPPTPRPAPAPTSAPHPPPPPPATSGASGAALTILNLVNQDRTANGLAPLHFDSALSTAAAQHAAQNAAAGQMTHDGIYQDLGAAGVAWTTLGECLGWDSGAPDPAYVNSMWMQSPEHRSIILGSFTKAGAGWARSPSGGSYVSLILTG